MNRKIEILRQIIDLSRQAITNVEIPVESFLSHLAASFTCTILENSSACFALIVNGHYTAIPILLRNIMEAHIDLLNIIKDENYKYIILYIFLHEKIREAGFVTKGNPFTAAIYDLPEFKNQLDIYKKEFDQIKLTIKKKDTSIKSRFKSVDENLYYIYKWLCHRSHNNLDALEERHFNIIENGYELSIFRPAKEATLLLYIDSIAGILVKSMAVFFSYLQIKNQYSDAIGSLLEELRAYPVPQTHFE